MPRLEDEAARRYVSRKLQQPQLPLTNHAVWLRTKIHGHKDERSKIRKNYLLSFGPLFLTVPRTANESSRYPRGDFFASLASFTVKGAEKSREGNRMIENRRAMNNRFAKPREVGHAKIIGRTGPP